MSETVKARLEQAIGRRSMLLDDQTNAVRLVHDAGDGFPGLTVEKWHRAMLVEAHRRDADPEPLLDALIGIAGADTSVFFKARWSRDAAARSGRQVSGPICDGEFEIRESGLRYAVHIVGQEHTGLFLDSRLARDRVRALSGGKRVLNLFSYTGGFGVSAAAGGARSTTNIDNKRSALAVARRNYALNGLYSDSRTFLKADAFEYLSRAVRGKGRYDLVILDPPPISRGPKRRFKVETGYVGLAAKCLRVLSCGGRLLAGLNGGRVSDDGFEDMLRQAAERVGCHARIVEHIGPGPDYPFAPDRPVARFILAQVNARGKK